MTATTLSTITYIGLIKDDIRDAITSRGGNLSGIPFDQWGAVVTGLKFREDTKVDPTPPPEPEPDPNTDTDPNPEPIGEIGSIYFSHFLELTGTLEQWEQSINPVRSVTVIAVSPEAMLDFYNSSMGRLHIIQGALGSRDQDVSDFYSDNNHNYGGITVGVISADLRETLETDPIRIERFKGRVWQHMLTVDSYRPNTNTERTSTFLSGYWDKASLTSSGWIPDYFEEDLRNSNLLPYLAKNYSSITSWVTVNEHELIASEYKFTINGQPPDVMTGIGTFNEVNGTFTGYLWDDSLRTPDGHNGRDNGRSGGNWCGSDALLAWSYASDNMIIDGVSTGVSYGNGHYYFAAGVENLPVTLQKPEVERMGWMDALDQSPSEAMWVNSLLVNTPIIIYSESSRINEVGRCCYSNGSYYSAVDLHHSFTNADIGIDDPLMLPFGGSRIFALMKRGISPEGFLFEPPSSIEPIEPIGQKHQGLPS